MGWRRKVNSCGSMPRVAAILSKLS
jgi:hypothetical protein